MITHTNIIILGSGPAGTSAAIYCGRAMHKTLLFSGPQPGGQLTLTSDIENYPGVIPPMDGYSLVQVMLEQAIKAGAQIINDQIIEVDLLHRPFKLISDSQKQYSCDALIIATGSKAKWLGLESEEKYRAGGVSSCAICDGSFYKNKQVVVIGGGNSALEEALYLAKIASKVVIIHRREYFTAERLLQERVFATSNITILWQHRVEEILGQNSLVNAVRLYNIKLAETQIISTDAVFIAIGHEPQSSLFKNQLNLYEDSYIKTEPGSTQTNIPGVFAAGDVADVKFRQAITAAGSGCMAAIEADKFLSVK
ncbi:thioredoxin-disulfide reductase [Bartonella sp. TP]|uniref:thioredoxin-disulfide reductase n=1 Tax=Bartonella sp. TP TaxID=3057550 RepID=UPI0025B04DC8|nr:thioredoxin-disulfide reductase [Bartonella sp. TP]WJW79731.1 thioredoxin-disulfide reductase [Bartonella sp. TP]